MLILFGETMRLKSRPIMIIMVTLLLADVLIWASILQPVIGSVTSVVATGAENWSTEYPSQRKLAMTSDGHLHVVYHRKDDNSIFQIYHAESIDGGRSWTEEQVTNAPRDQNYPALAVDSKDHLHLIWQDGLRHERGIIHYGYYKKKTTSWQDAELVASYVQVPSIAIDSNDDVHVVYGPSRAGGNGIRWRKRTSAGWQPEESLSGEKYYVNLPSIAIDGNNDVHVVWGHVPTQSFDVHYRKRTSTGWGQEVEVGSGSDYGTNPSFAIDSNNHIHVVWYHRSLGYYYIKHREYTTSWQPIEDLEGPTTYSQFHATISIDRSDNIHVVWTGEHSGSPTYLQVRYRRYTTSWQPIEELTSSTSYNQNFPSSMSALYPTINGVRTNMQQNGCSFIWIDGNTIKYWSNADQEAPITSELVAVPNPVSVNTSVTITATVDDSTTGSSKITAAQYRVDSGPWMPMAAEDGVFDEMTEIVTASIGPFDIPGVRSICVRGADEFGNWSPEECILLAVYDPADGFVTGGGWINSPPGAYYANPTLIGKATFGFVSKYLKGATVPTGQTEFRFRVADLNFHSTSYEWLVVAGARAQYKGSGTINGDGNFGFILTVIDGQINGGRGVDKFRIKIWDRATGNIVYDNQIGDADTDDLTTTISGGNIIIHK